MTQIKSPIKSIAAAGLLSAALAAPADAVVGGRDAREGELPATAHVLIDENFQCTGTLIAPTWVVTASHCASLVPGAVVNVPVGTPGQLIEVTLGTIQNPGTGGTGGEKIRAKRAVVHPQWAGLLTVSYDVTLLELSAPSTQAPVPVAGRTEEGLWAPGTLATIAGFGVTSEGGDQPDVLQVAQVPIVPDAEAAAAYDSFENVSQIGAGFPQGGVDTCQGDSGGPLYVPAAGGGLRLAGDTSYGDGCARPGKPGIYGRLGDDTLREWIRSIAPEGVAPDTATTKKTRGQRAQKATALGRGDATLR